MMIEKISSVENRRITPKRDASSNQPSFKGIGDLALRGIQMCEEIPMLNVSVLDLSTAIVPRTIIETRESNAYAGMEAFRRESSGLIVNCLLPSFIVMGLAGLLQKTGVVKGVNGMSNVWANEESLKITQKYLQNAQGTGSKKLENALTSFLNDLTGVDGNKKVAFKEFDLSSPIKSISKSILMKNPKKLFKKGYSELASTTHMTEHLELDGKVLSKNLKGYVEDFVSVHKATVKNNIKTSEQLSNFINKSIKLVNWKSLTGLGVIIPLAISMQPLNRWLTAKHSGVKGAPIYKDFGKNQEQKELTPKEKSALLKQKFISVGSMIGVMLMSMGFKLPGKEMLQFKGIFPTMDQARLISTATFASRMMAAEDKNELREATIRDIATFSSLYFLGDYAAKGVATVIEKFSKKPVKLLNDLKPFKQGENPNIFKKLKHWVKDVNLKSSDEVATKFAKNMRSVCQIGNLAFSLLALGIFIPLYTRTQTNKKREAELRELNKSVDTSNTFIKNRIKNDSPTFKAFIE